MEGELDSQSDNLVSDVKKQVEDLIITDKKHEFVACIQTQVEKERCGISKVELCPSELLMSICSHCAVDCATALLEGETGLVVDLNVAFKNGIYPMHYAAQNLSLNLTKLLLRHGAKADLQSKCGGILPLSLALEAICKKEFLLDWAPHKSIFKLIYILCLPELREPLETIKLLALNTEDLPVISLGIAREGMLRQLAVLLMVAREKLLITQAGADVSPIEQCILKELQLIIDEEFNLMWCGSQHSKALRMCKHKNNLLLSAAVMLDVFDQTGNVLDKYRLSERTKEISRCRLAVEVSVFFKVLGFNLKRKDAHVDDISCFLTKLGSEQAGDLKKKLQQESRVSNRAKKIVSSQHSPAVPRACLQPFHTYLTSKARMDDKLCAPTTSRAIRTTPKLVERSFFSNAIAKGWASIALTLQRRIRVA